MSGSFQALQVCYRQDGLPEIRAFTPESSETRLVTGVPTTACPIRSLLTNSAADELSLLAESGQPNLLLIDEQSPREWSDLPWEAMTIGKHKIGDFSLVVRRAQVIIAKDNIQSNRRKRSVWLNLFPKSDTQNGYGFSKEFEPLVEKELLQRVVPTSLAEGMDGFEELFVLAHGDNHGLLDEHNQPFAELLNSILPERVWLLACNQGMAMYRLAEHLLENGVKTVIAATGDISAPAMAQLVIDWLNRGVDAPDDPVSFLLNRRGFSESNGDTKALTIFGKVALDKSAGADWNRITWDAWRTADPDSARISDCSEFGFKLALEAIESTSEKLLWRQTMQWMVPGTLVLAQAYDHRAMLRLSRLDAANSLSAASYDARAAERYRAGDYQGMARNIANGLPLALPYQSVWTSLTRHLVLLLIDMEMTDVASAVVNRHSLSEVEDSSVDPPWSTMRLDWRSRIAFKQAKFDSAIDLMQRKWNLEKDKQGKARREQAWLLYMRSWKQHITKQQDQEASRLAGETAACLNAFIEIHDTPEKRSAALPGNNDEIYLLRALCCYFWVTQDQGALESITPWITVIAEELLSKVDPGPGSFAGTYLYMANAVHKNMFDRAISALDSAEYWLEAAQFAALAGEAKRNEELKSKFLERRDQALKELGQVLENLEIQVPEQSNEISVIPA